MSRNATAFALLLSLAAFVAALSGGPSAYAAPEKYRVVSSNWEVSAPGANTDAITDVTWGKDGEVLRLTIQCDTSTVVNLMVSRGGTENALGMNSNTAVVAGALYVFDVPGLLASDTINVQVETDSAIPQLAIGRLEDGR